MTDIVGVDFAAVPDTPLKSICVESNDNLIKNFANTRTLCAEHSIENEVMLLVGGHARVGKVGEIAYFSYIQEKNRFH